MANNPTGFYLSISFLFVTFAKDLNLHMRNTGLHIHNPYAPLPVSDAWAGCRIVHVHWFSGFI